MVAAGDDAEERNYRHPTDQARGHRRLPASTYRLQYAYRRGRGYRRLSAPCPNGTPVLIEGGAPTAGRVSMDMLCGFDQCPACESRQSGGVVGAGLRSKTSPHCGYSQLWFVCIDRARSLAKWVRAHGEAKTIYTCTGRVARRRNGRAMPVHGLEHVGRNHCREAAGSRTSRSRNPADCRNREVMLAENAGPRASAKSTGSRVAARSPAP